MVAFTILVTQIVTFIDNDQSVVAGTALVNRFSHRHHIGFQIVLVTILLPHFHQISRADNQRTTGKGHFIDLGNGTGCNSLTQTYHIANHGTTTLLAIQMTGCYLDGNLLKVEHLALEIWGQGKLLHATTSLCTQMVCCLEINIIWWDHHFACPAIIDDINQFFGDVYAEPVIPAIIKPFCKCFQITMIFDVCIQLSLFG